MAGNIQGLGPHFFNPSSDSQNSRPDENKCSSFTTVAKKALAACPGKGVPELTKEFAVLSKIDEHIRSSRFSSAALIEMLEQGIQPSEHSLLDYVNRVKRGDISERCLELLVENGANVNPTVDNSLFTPLNILVSRSEAAAVKKLLDLGASNNRNTLSLVSCPRTAEVLLENGIQVSREAFHVLRSASQVSEDKENYTAVLALFKKHFSC